MDEPIDDNDIEQEIANEALMDKEMSFLFGEDIVEQSRILDIAQLNLSDEMTAVIGKGINKLKELKNNPEAQRQWVHDQPLGSQLLLCLWIIDMGLLHKIQSRSYLSH